MSPLKIFFTRFSHFLTGMGVAQLFGLLTFPILTRALTKEQYGVMSLINTTMLLAVAISKAGLSDGIIRFYKEYSADPEKLTIFSSTVFMRGLVFSIFSVILYLAAIPVINHYLKYDRTYILCFIVMAFSLFIRPLIMIIVNFLRAIGKTVFLNVISIVGATISVGLSLFFLLYVIGGLYGYFIGGVIAEYALGGIFFYWFFKQYKVMPSRVSGDLAIQLIKFGLPLLFSECAFLALSYADRYLIVAYYNESVLGLYSVGYNLAMYIANILMFSISYSIVPIYVDIYNSEGKEKTEEFLGKCLHYILIAFIPICFGYIAISKDLFTTLASEKYASAASFSPIILIGSIFFALNYILNAGLYLAKRSMTMLGIMLLAVAVNILLNILLLPPYGVMGAAIATLVACIMVPVLSAVLSRKHFKMKVNMTTLAYYIVLSSCMLLVVKQIETSTSWLNLILKIVTGVIIVALGTLYREDEIVYLIKSKLKAVQYHQ